MGNQERLLLAFYPDALRHGFEFNRAMNSPAAKNPANAIEQKRLT
jgi:hypothetical protein